MIKNLFLLIFTISSLSSADLANFDKTSYFARCKKIVQNEESIARAYEQYILDKYEIPSNINTQLYTTNYLGSSSVFLLLLQLLVHILILSHGSK